jgi:hypothetical protein
MRKTGDFEHRVSSSIEASTAVKQRLLGSKEVISTVAKGGEILVRAFDRGNKVLLLCGNGGSGSGHPAHCRKSLWDASPYCICVPSNEAPRIQECHILIGHIIAELVEQAISMIREAFLDRDAVINQKAPAADTSRAGNGCIFPLKQPKLLHSAIGLSERLNAW